MKLRTFRKAVGTAGTQERLTTNDIKVQWVRIQPEDDNTGVVFVGDSEVSSASGIELMVSAAAGVRSVSFVEFSASLIGGEISLRDIWLDVATGADGVIAAYFVNE